MATISFKTLEVWNIERAGNIKSVELIAIFNVEDIEKSRKLASQLKNDRDFYNLCSSEAKSRYRQNYDIKVWKNKIKLQLS